MSDNYKFLKNNEYRLYELVTKVDNKEAVANINTMIETIYGKTKNPLEIEYYKMQTLDFSQLNNLGIPKELLFLLPLSVIASTFIFSFGALGEEIGWRGYLYPKLEELFGTTKAVIIGGIIWGVWHFPAIYAGHNFGHDYIGEPWTGFAVFTIFTTVVGAVLYYFTKRTDSVWVAAFMHAANNAFSAATILGLAYSDKKISGLALESPLRLLIISIPVIILGIFSLIRLKKDF